MHTDPHKLDFRSDLLARLPGAGGLGPLGPIGGAMPPTHDLTRPPSLFSATGACLNFFVSQECELLCNVLHASKMVFKLSGLVFPRCCILLL